MPQEWFVRRGDQERGPISSNDLKRLVSKGIVSSSDMVRTAETSQWRVAGTVKGLFETERSETSVPPRPPQLNAKSSNVSVTPSHSSKPRATNRQAPTSEVASSVQARPPGWQRLPFVVLLTVCCWPVGLLLVWFNPRLARRSKLIWTGVSAVVVIASLSLLQPPKTRSTARTTVTSTAKAESESIDKPLDQKPHEASSTSSHGSVPIQKSDPITTPEHGPNDEKVQAEKWGTNSEWVTHFYLDTNGKKVQHGLTRTGVAGIEPGLMCVKESQYDQGVLMKSVLYNSRKEIVQEFTLLGDGIYMKDEYERRPNGSTQHFRVKVSITKTANGEERKELTKREIISDDLVQDAHDLAQHIPDDERPPVAVSRIGGRELKVGIAKVERDMILAEIQKSLKNVRCFATEDGVTLTFDIDDAHLRPHIPWNPCPIHVRLFDKNGSFLTHFFTNELFTSDVQQYVIFRKNYEQEALAAKRIGRNLKEVRRPLFLHVKNNKIDYKVNVRDLRDAAIVEFGFTDKY